MEDSQKGAQNRCRAWLTGLIGAAPRVVNWLSWVPPVLTLAVSIHYTVNLPRSDYWEIAAPVPFALHDGDFSIQKLREPVMGARMTTTRLIYAALGSLSGWDQHTDTAAIVLFSLLTFFCIRRIIRRTWSEFPLRRSGMNLLASLLIFWLMLGSYWVFSPLIWHSVVIACVAGVIMVMSARHSPPLRRVILSVVLCFVATGAFLPGWIAWVVLFGMILLLAWADRGEWRWWGAAIYAAVSLAANIAIYFIGLERNPEAGGRAAGTLSAGEYLQFFARWLGNPFSSPPPSMLLSEQGGWQMKASLVIGAVMLVVTAAVLLAALIRCWKNPADARRLAPWMALAGFGLTEGAAMTFGRAAMTPTWYSLGRYVSFSIWVYLAVLGILLCFPKVSAARRALRIGGLAALPFFLLSYAWGARFGLERIEADAAATRQFRAGVQLMPLYIGKGLGIEDDVIDQPFAHPAASLFQYARAADQAGFLHPHLVAGNLWMEADLRVERDFPVKGQFELLEHEQGVWMASGWAVHTGRRSRIDAVVLTVENPDGDEKLLGIAQHRSKRLNFAKRFGVREFRPQLGWMFNAADERWSRQVKPGCVVRAYAMDTDEAKLYRLEGEHRHSEEAEKKARIPIDLSASKPSKK